MEKEAQKARRSILITFAVFAVIFALAAFGLCRHMYWHSFSTEKWLKYPEKRANMTADLFEDHALIGMTEDEILRLLGPNNNDCEYFSREDRFVYYLGNERSFIDSEWLLIDFENGAVCAYSTAMD